MKFSWLVFGSIIGLGLIGGALSGLLGIGSGIIMVPVLSAIWAKQPEAQKIAQGTALAVMVPMTVAGALSYHFGGSAGNLKLGLPIVLWGLLIGAIALSIPLRLAPMLGLTETLGHVNWSYVALLAIGGAVGSTWLGAPLANALPTATLKMIFGVFMVIVGLRMTGAFGALWGLLHR